MQISVNGNAVNVTTGGRDHASGRPFAVFLHGAGLDHSVWALQSRWLAFHGWNVLAVDLPGHGESGGQPLTGVHAMAQWVAALLGTVGAPSATLIGHSMGALIALETAATFPGCVDSLVLIGAAASMPVHPDLLAAALANDHAAIEMVNLWGYGYRAGIGASRAPGVWMVGLGERILERAAPGVLHADLAACNAYGTGMAAAASIRVPALIVAGEKDQMTPLKNARALAEAIAGSSLTVIEGAGHMLLAECPDDILQAFTKHLHAGSLVRR